MKVIEGWNSHSAVRVTLTWVASDSSYSKNYLKRKGNQTILIPIFFF